MSSSRRGRVLGVPAAVLVAFAALASPHARGGEGDRSPGPGSKTLTVCAVPASMPRMGKAPDGTPQGLDVALIRLVARILGRPVEFHWCGGAECAWRCLPEKRCDVVIGQPSKSGPP